jgi:hypothetical protein
MGKNTHVKIEVEGEREHKEALGELVMQWSFMESAVSSFLRALLNVDDNTARAVFGDLDIRDRIQIAKTLGFLRQQDISWYADLKEVLDLIDNELRTTRNRFIHDLWAHGGNNMVRVSTAPKFTKPQARKLKLTLGQKVHVEKGEVATFAERIRAAGYVITLLEHEYLGSPKMPSSERRAARFLQVGEPGARHPPGYFVLIGQPQPPASPE